MESIKLLQGESIFSEEREAVFRKDTFKYTHVGIKDKQGEMWTTTELDEINIYQIYNQYRVKHGIPFPDEIIQIRKHYGLSAAKMSQILGFGINQYRMYEDGEVPSISNARTIIAIREKSVFSSFIEASKSEISNAEYTRIIKKLDSIKEDIKPINQPTVFSGYKTLSLVKVANIIQLIISILGSTFVTKMSKLLFYVDFIHYKKHAYGITGIAYRALQFGPVPNNWGKLYNSLDGIEMSEFIYPNGHSGIKIESTMPVENSLSESEYETVLKVCSYFKEMKAGEISEISQLEKGWINNKNNQNFISYQDAFLLNYD